MNAYSIVKNETGAKPTFTPVTSGLLQRACACGQHSAGSGGECDKCKKKHEGTLQRTLVNPALALQVPPIVDDVLRSPGQPLNGATRAFMEPRFSHDFSQVRIHTDTRAAESAQAVNALAYTIGSDIVFDTAQYAPDSYTGKQLLAHELTHVIQQSLGAATGPPPLATSKLEVTANQAASAVMEGTTVQVTDASAPGLARQQRWLSKNPNPQSLSDQALQRELQLIRQWLLDHPMSSPETQRLGEVLAIFEQEAASRPTRSTEGPTRRTKTRSDTQPGTGLPTLAAGATMALPANTLIGTGGATTAGASEAGLAAVISVPLAAVIAFFAVLLYPSSVVSGEEEQQMLEQARQQAQSRLQVTLGPGAPNLEQAIRMFRTALTTLGTDTVLAISSEVIDRDRGRVQDILDQVEELIRNNPRFAMRCSQEVIAFRQAVQAAFDYLSLPGNQINAFQLRRLLDIMDQALTNLLACMNVAPPSP